MSPSQSSIPTSPSSLIHSIQQNWSLETSTSILPQSLLSNDTSTQIPLPLLHALDTLSSLTPDQPDRAYSLLNTYFHARIRQGSYRGTQGAIVAGLEVDDVEAACDSVRRMMRGKEMQGVTSETEKGKGKRKYSIRQEREDGDDDENDTMVSKTQKLSYEYTSSAVDDKFHALPSPSLTVSTATIEKEQDNTATALAPVTPRTKRLIHLPPIRTSHITTPITASLPSAHTTSFTPLFNSLKQEVGYTYTPPPIVYTPHPSHTPNPNRPYYRPQQQQRQPIPQHHHYPTTEEIMRERKREQILQAAQRATHNFNVLRRDTERLGRAYEEARG
ncbi:hypothetical protein A1F96_05829 [Pyrenophora tritici-repentis]|nr:hypothetical protein PtrEW7m1_003719 [Pyrenophora tritici-repentis]PZD28545.1 hypothetical protein A1F96_05829 [Pyrenophora tritici-repentis]